MLLLLFCLFLLSSQGEGAEGDHLTRQEVMSWVKLRVLEGLGVEEPPLVQVLKEERRNLGRSGPKRRALREDHERVEMEEMQIILFASSGPSSNFTFLFQPSTHHHVISAQLWFFSGTSLRANSSNPVSVLTSGQRLLLASPGPTRVSKDGWSTFDLNWSALELLRASSLWLHIHCVECQCFNNPDKTPFLNLKVTNKAPSRRQRSLSIPWSPSVVDLLQRPSQETHEDCSRAHIEISFEELGWDSWIVDPKTLTFYYCQGNCSSPERSTVRLGLTQCCAPVPGSMRSIRITTTSDGGYSFKYETLPNLMPEECACI